MVLCEKADIDVTDRSVFQDKKAPYVEALLRSQGRWPFDDEEEGLFLKRKKLE